MKINLLDDDFIVLDVLESDTTWNIVFGNENDSHFEEGGFCPQLPPYCSAVWDGRNLVVFDQNYGQFTRYEGIVDLSIFFNSKKFIDWFHRSLEPLPYVVQETIGGWKQSPIFYGTQEECEEYIESCNGSFAVLPEWDCEY